MICLIFSKILGEFIGLATVDINNLIMQSPMMYYELLPEKNLTIKDITVSPIDDHQTYGMQI